MHGHGKSDRSVVPEKPANKAGGAPQAAEQVEGRDLAKGNSSQQNKGRTQCREPLPSELERVRQAAIRDKKLRFTALWHHVYDVDRLRKVYNAMKRNAAAGVDGETWEHYGERLEENLQELSARLKRGAYRAKPVRRVYIPKADGRQRPLGVPALEDKIVQGATVEVLNAIYETDFLGFSYGFRPGRSQHNALDALTVGILRKKVSWVLDGDIRGFFDAVSHEWTEKFVEHRIADQRVVQHIKKWLKAGVLEDGKRMRTEEGTPQGGSISPLLANIYLHYAFDLWAHMWRRKHARGDVIIVRYADDICAGFQYRSDAERFRMELEERFGKFQLELHPEKTRVIEFGRFAAENRKKRGQGKPETFDFLGFTHICGKKRNGKFAVLRQTKRKRMRAKLREVKQKLRMSMHEPIPKVGAWLQAVVQGHMQYFAVPRNYVAVSIFRFEVIKLWFRTLRRRSQKTRMNWKRMKRLVRRWIPNVRVMHLYPEQRLCVATQGKSPVR
jgi:group II intron reverse transcriptase/maturase